MALSYVAPDFQRFCHKHHFEGFPFEGVEFVIFPYKGNQDYAFDNPTKSWSWETLDTSKIAKEKDEETSESVEGAEWGLGFRGEEVRWWFCPKILSWDLPLPKEHIKIIRVHSFHLGPLSGGRANTNFEYVEFSIPNINDLIRSKHQTKKRLLTLQEIMDLEHKQALKTVKTTAKKLKCLYPDIFGETFIDPDSSSNSSFSGMKEPTKRTKSSPKLKVKKFLVKISPSSPRKKKQKNT